MRKESILRQLELELEWLSDTWSPKPSDVKIFRGKKEMTDEGFDNWFVENMGYESIQECNQHNYNKDMQKLMNYGDRAKGLI